MTRRHVLGMAAAAPVAPGDLAPQVRKCALCAGPVGSFGMIVGRLEVRGLPTRTLHWCRDCRQARGREFLKLLQQSGLVGDRAEKW